MCTVTAIERLIATLNTCELAYVITNNRVYIYSELEELDNQVANTEVWEFNPDGSFKAIL